MAQNITVRVLRDGAPWLGDKVTGRSVKTIASREYKGHTVQDVTVKGQNPDVTLHDVFNAEGVRVARIIAPKGAQPVTPAVTEGDKTPEPEPEVPALFREPQG